MVKVTVGADIVNFQYNWSGNPPAIDDPYQTQYYTYEEQSDYTPIVIALDSTENPLEIGAFIGDTCIGASVVLPEDSLCLLPAYTQGYSGEISFQQYFDPTKSSPQLIHTYYVRNKQTGKNDKRAIHSKEQAPIFFISFKDLLMPDELHGNATSIEVFPNPTNGLINIMVSNPVSGLLRIECADMLGKTLSSIHKQYKPGGSTNIHFNFKEMQLPKGVYLLRVSTEHEVVTKKIVYGN
jgi:hypothetical protein